MADNLRKQLNQAVQRKKEKKYESAWEIFQSLKEHLHRSVYFWSNFAHLASLMKRFSEAREYAETALSLKPQHAFTKSIYADILLNLNEWSTSLSIAKEVMEDKPDVYLLRKLIKVCETQNQLPQLAPLFQDWVPHYRDNSDFVTIPFSAIRVHHFFKLSN